MPNEVTLSPASELGLEPLASLFNAAYEGYAVPMHVDAGAMEFMLEAMDLVPERSRVAWRDGAPVGVAMLGVRGTRGWVGGMGVVTAARRGGVGRLLMRALIEEARAAGVRELFLEVLEQNTSARALYEELGFRPLRRLEVWTYAGAPPANHGTAQACDPREARRRIAASRTEREPWQRADDTVDRLDVSTPALRAVTTPGGDAVYRVTDGRASVLQLAAGSETAAGVLLDTIRTRDGVNVVRFLNVPSTDTAVAALARRDAKCELAQTEMSLAL
ncbi:MAG TPA: GNAT family N-acetyltransferase [Gemmatimonadales bacterium]|nr:GNAT family N-acetyltransferase [Gemmatimonadales bacterium]